MEKSSILSADILDILFEGRNKSYGAYELRKTYDRRITWSITGTLLLCLLFMVGSILAHGKKKAITDYVTAEIELKNIKEEQPKVEPPKELPKEEVKVATAKVTPPVIVPDELVEEKDEVKPVDELVNVKVGTVDVDGKIDEVVSAPVEKTGIINTAPKEEIDIDKPFTSVQIQARFPGDMEGWRKFLERNLNKDVPSENGAPLGDYTVTISFIVDRSGNISDVRAENDPGYGTKAEAIKVILKSPKWQPAIQNGREVIYRQKQNITFRVSD